MQNELKKISDHDLEVSLARNDYSFYVEYTHRGLYLPARHTDYVCERLQKVEQGEIKRLMIFMPPRHSKSMTVSETFPSYFIGKKPKRRVIEVSYADSLAKKFGRANRRKVEEYGAELFGILVASDNATMTNWGIEGCPGGMISAGIGGPITGEGADLLLIDDPIKNRMEAESETYREMVWNEWQNTLLTRLHPGAAVIIILTRWHEDDLAGRLLAQEQGKWEVISLPAEAEENDPLGREPGEPLWPQRGYDKAWLEETKKDVGSRTWNSLYQQQPRPQEGAILKRHWWKFWCYPGQEDKLQPVILKKPDSEGGGFITVKPVPLPSRFDQLAQSWDMAFKDTKDSAYVAGQVWSKYKSDKFLLDQLRDKMDFVVTVQALETLTKKWPEAKAKWVEDKANGPAVIASLKRKITGLIPVQPEGSKEARAHAVSPECESGNVFLPHPQIAPWVWDFIEECAAFPNGKYADQVDTMTQAVNRLDSRGPAAKALGSKPRGW